MKIFKSIFIIIVVMALSVIVLKGVKTKKSSDPIPQPDSREIDLSPEINSRQLCFVWNSERGDKALLSMDIRGENVIGEFYWLPKEKDQKTGIFKGTVSPVDPNIMGRRVDAIWDARGEGVINQEELKIIFGEGTANVGFGEMKDRGDGVYVYADPLKLSYEPSLTDTDCGDNAMD